MCRIDWHFSWDSLIPRGVGRVPDYGSPTVRRRRLAAELRRLRERAGFTGDEVADRLGWSASKISRIELHRTGIKQADLLRLLDLYGVADVHREGLVALARESSKAGRLEAVASSLPGEYAAFLYAEAEAKSVWTWDPQIIPGLLQTADYARAVMLRWDDVFPVPPGDIDRRVEARLLRQQVLHRQPPFVLSVVIDESVLYRRLGDNSIMREQLNRLIEIAELPNVTVQVLPLDGIQSITTSAFIYMRFSEVHDVSLHDIAIIEHLSGSDYVEDEEDTHKYFRLFRSLATKAVPERVSISLIRKAAQEAWAT
jgi:transcriptional regulator with XRE-family HTH domain